MRSAVLLLALAAPLPFAAAQPSTLGRVKAAAVLRAGPSEQMPACGSLEAGEEVIIHHVEGSAWLAIQPPRGALSWISQLCVEVKRPPDAAPNKYPVDGIVSPLDGGDVKVAAGSMGESKPLNVQRTKLPAGTLVRIIGPKVTVNADDGDSGWYPIVPPRDDFRYVLRFAVETTGTAERGGFTVTQAKVEETASSNPGVLSIRPTGDANWPNSALWRDAERHRADGNFAKAEELYFQVAKEANKGGDVRLANLCYERVHMVRDQNRSPLKAIPAAVAAKPDDVSWRAGEVPKAAKLEAPSGSTVYGDGILRRVSFEYKSQKVFALTDQKGQVRYYILPNGNDLDRHVGKWLEVAGTGSSPKEFGGDTVLSVSKVESVK